MTGILARQLAQAGIDIEEFADLAPFHMLMLPPGRTLLEKLLRVNNFVIDEARRSAHGWPRIGRQFYDRWATRRSRRSPSTWSGAVQQSVTIDWSLKESVRAAMRAKVRRLLAKYGYPPDREERAVELVLQQAELFASSGAPG